MAKSSKRGLGRGLDAILQNPDTDITSNTFNDATVVGAITEIPLEFIETNPFQPRDEFEEQALRELAESIKEHGFIQPVTVRKMGHDRYQLISGGRRHKAAIMLNLKNIPAYIRIADDEQMLEMALVENIQRQNLNPIEIAISYKRLIDECKLTQEELSKKISKNRSTISNFLRLLNLPDIAQHALKEEKITIGHAKPLSSIKDEKKIVELLRIIIENNLSVRETEKLISDNKNQKGEKKKTNAIPQVLSARVANFRQSFNNHTGLNAKIKISKNGKGTINIAFKSEEHLNKLIKVFEHIENDKT